MNLRREAITSETYWEFQPGERVMTVDGYPGVVDAVEDGPIANAENYVVTLDKGLGGGNYSASMLAKMPTSRSAAGIHLATDDYPELGSVIDDRPDPGKMSFTAALSQERQEADAEDHDEPGGDDQPHSCSYCGGTEFKDFADNGRVRQATCATCNGTMSAHPGVQWTPELIGDPSNHPKPIIDPRSGASPGAGAPGQAGINDFIDYNSRVSTTAAYAAGPCPTCKGKGAVSWRDLDPDWKGESDENPGKVYTDECDDCGGKGHMPAVSDEEIAHAKQQAKEDRARATTQHVQEKHPIGEVVTYDDVKGCGPRCPVAAEWDRRGRKPFYHRGSVNLTALHIVGTPKLATHHEDEITRANLPLLHPDDTHAERTGKLTKHYEHLWNDPGPEEEAYAQGHHPLAMHHQDHGVPKFAENTHLTEEPGIKAPIAAQLSRHLAHLPAHQRPQVSVSTPHYDGAMEDGTLAYFSPERNRIGVHRGLARSMEHNPRMAGIDLPKQGWLSRHNDTPLKNHVLTHESGHVLDYAKHDVSPHDPHSGNEERSHLLNKIASAIPGVTPYKHGASQYHWMLDNREHFINHVGTYASTDPSELIGELYTQHHHHPNPSPAARVVARHLEGETDEDRSPHAGEAGGSVGRAAPEGSNSGGGAGHHEDRDPTGGAFRGRLSPEAAAMLRTAARDREFGFHVTASWADVQRKAKRIRSEGGVTIVIASNDGIGGTVQGDHGTYEALLVYRPGTKKVSDWTCGCKWAAYAFERSPGFQRFEGRKCSHALALQFEAQSQGMFGKEVHPSEPTSRERTIVRYDPDAGEHVFARPYEGSLLGSLVAQLREEDADPAEVVGNLVRAGVRHKTAVLLWRHAEHHEDAERRCPHCGGFIGVEAVEHHHCPHCGAPLGGEGHEHHHGSMESPIYYHGTTAEGLTHVLPSSQHGGHVLYSGAADPGHAYATTDLGDAWNYAKTSYHNTEHGVPRVYEVSPLHGDHSHVEHDPNFNDTTSFRSPHGFHVTRELPMPDHMKSSGHWGEQRGEYPSWEHLGAKEKQPPGPSVSGIALKAHDTGRVLMLQRGLDDKDDPAAGTWEFPGGHHEEGDRSSLHAGIREWEEEVGQEFPLHGAVKHVWTSPNGVYQGHVVVIPSEKDLSMKDGRVVPNPDDPKGDSHEQAAWWDPEHARKIPNLRAEVKEHTPWKEIGKASLDAAKTASAWDPISNTNPQPGRGTSEPAHSNTTNPASTGWAAGEDPDNWNNLDANPQPLTPSLGFDAVLHDQPEPALPVAYGDEDATMRPAEMTQADLDPVPDNPPPAADLVPDSDANIHLLNGGSMLPNSYHAAAEGDRVADIVAAFQKSAAGQQLMTDPEGEGNDDIAAAAKAHLEKTAAKQFGFAEQQELITEGNDGRRARNLAALRIKGTHYELLDAALQGEATDSTDLFI